MRINITTLMGKYAGNGNYPVSIKEIPLVEYPVLSSGAVKGKADLTILNEESFSLTVNLYGEKLSSKKFCLNMDDDIIEVGLNLMSHTAKDNTKKE